MNKYFAFFNSNPKQKYNRDGSPKAWGGADCGVRSLSKAMDWSWMDTYDYLVDICRESFMICDDSELLKKAWKKLCFVKAPAIKGTKPTINEFCKSHKKGTFIISLAGHVVCVCNGKFYDTWDCGDYKVRSYWMK